MPRMRHPKIPGTEITPAVSAVPFHCRAGWLTEDEWEAAGIADPEPEDTEAAESAEQEQKKPSRRAKPRATSEEESD